MKFIISIILIIASISFFVFFTKPKWDELNINKVEVEKLNVAQQNAKLLKSKIDALLKIKTSIPETDIEKIKKMLPDNVENVKLIIDFDEMLKDLITQKGTAAIYKKSDLFESGDFAIENPNITKGNTTIEGDFDSTQLGVADFTFTVSLTYGDFLDFLRMIETSTRIFDIESISFTSPGAQDIKNPDEIIYNFNIALKTYWLKSK